MTRPGTQIITSDTVPPRGAVIDTGTWFPTGLTEKGSHTKPLTLRNLNDYARLCGVRVSYGVLYDSLDAYFREGGTKAIVGRIVGPAPVAASHNLVDGAAADCLKVAANSVGEWGNTLNVQVTAGDVGGEFKLVITDDVLGALETTPSLATTADAVSWSAGSDYVTITQLASVLDPAVAASAGLSGGTDDRANITNTQRANALALFTKDLGPGQVSSPGVTTAAVHEQLLDHASAFNRTAILDGEDTATAATLIGSAAVLRATSTARDGATHVPPAKVPGLTPGTLRTVPYSAVQAGIYARNDGAGRTQNTPGAGELGKARYAVDLTQTYSDSDREALNAAGVNVARILYGGVRSYGNRTLASSVSLPNWTQMANKRMHMTIAARADAIAEKYVHAMVDGAGITISRFGGDLRAMLVPMWEAGALFGATFEDACAVDVSDAVNTDETLAAGELHALVAVRLSPGAELVVIEITKVPITDSVA